MGSSIERDFKFSNDLKTSGLPPLITSDTHRPKEGAEKSDRSRRGSFKRERSFEIIRDISPSPSHDEYDDDEMTNASEVSEITPMSFVSSYTSMSLDSKYMELKMKKRALERRI